MHTQQFALIPIHSMQYTRKLPSIKDQNHTDCVTVTLLTITLTHNLDFQSQ